MLDRHRFTLSAVVLASLLSAATASAAFQAYASFKGTKQGQIKASESASKTDANAFRIESYKIIDPAGAPAGKRKHAPLVITKEVDSASPKIFQALQSNEAFSQVTIKATDPDVKGSGITVDLANGRVLKIEHVGADAQHPSLSKTKQYEEISFAYQKITVSYESGKTEADDWEAPSP
jgi:type VI secretion system secreted protein Hcp